MKGNSREDGRIPIPTCFPAWRSMGCNEDKWLQMLMLLFLGLLLTNQR